MTRFPAGTLLLAAGFALWGAGTTGCSRKDDTAKHTPVAEVQSQSPLQQANEPMSVVGCLRAGDAPDTFVLTASQAKDGEQPATYTLVGSGGVNLGDHIGERVNASGTMIAQQSARARTLPQEQDKATGTSGTPTVRTETDLRLRQLNVTAVTSTGERCDK